jgi:hypothetical protein
METGSDLGFEITAGEPHEPVNLPLDQVAAAINRPYDAALLTFDVGDFPCCGKENLEPVVMLGYKRPRRLDELEGVGTDSAPVERLWIDGRRRRHPVA